MKTIREIMRPSFLFRVRRTDTVSGAVRIMADNNIGIVAVVEGDVLVGVLSERDVVQRVVALGRNPSHTTVEQVMTTELVLGDATEDCHLAMLKMDRANIRHLPVMSGGRLVSMLSIRDLMRAELTAAGVELEFLRAYLYQVPSGPANLQHPR